jgi:hypothetical protein
MTGKKFSCLSDVMKMLENPKKTVVCFGGIYGKKNENFKVIVEAGSINYDDNIKEAIVHCAVDDCGRQALVLHTRGTMEAGKTYKLATIPRICDDGYLILDADFKSIPKTRSK